MPASRPRAAFEPLSPEFDLRALVENTPNFTWVDRIDCDTLDEQGFEAFDKLVLLHVVIGGKPLVIDGYERRLDPWTFSPKWLQENVGEKQENARNINEKAALPLTIGHYLRNVGVLTEQFFENDSNYKDKKRQRIYLKDIDVPDVWSDKLREHLPPNLYYLNSSTGEIGGPGATYEIASGGGRRKGRGIAGAGDLMSSLPEPMRAENLMSYIGHEGTFTPAHREMCGTLGHNIMVEASDVVGDDGKPEREGSSIWFMTESKDRHTVSEYWLSDLGHDIEVETHFAQVAAWKKAPFQVYVVDQRPGDFILIPPLAPHQVWNRGTRTMKVAWNRTTVETLEMAMHEALPRARMVCRDEQYKNKAIVYYTLQKYSALLARARDQQQTAPNPQEAHALRSSPRIRQLQKDFKRLFRLYQEILLSEMFSTETPHEKNVQFLPFDSNVTCAYCRGNIFNRFLTCKTCEDVLGTENPEPYDVCMECYAMGRSCGCVSKLQWCEQFKWKELTQKYEFWRRQFNELEQELKDDSPRPLADERARLGKKTLAQVCQEQLKRRPWIDVKKPPEEPEESDENDIIAYNDDGTVKKKALTKRKSEKYLKEHKSCHVCCHRHPKWKMAECICGRWWCYGVLFRGFDLMPQQVMEDSHWRCPHCKNICSGGQCRKDPRQKAYEPKGTLLGHDTKKVADVRSIESLVDFSKSNLNWLDETPKAAADGSRLHKKQAEAEQAKLDNIALNEHYVDDEVGEDSIEFEADTSVIDPALAGPSSSTVSQSNRNLQNTTRVPNGAPTVASMLNANTTEGAGEISGYAPAEQFVAPAAIMWRSPQEQDAEGEPYEWDDVQTEESPATLKKSKKRKRNTGDDIDGTASTKKARSAGGRRSLPDPKSLSGASKQYKKEQEKKALEEAKRNGSFIRVHAALKGREKVVVLRVPRELLIKLEAEERDEEGSLDAGALPAKQQATNTTVLLTSDVLPVAPTLGLAESIPNRTQVKPPKQVRIRVERDDDFKVRSRQRETGESTEKRGRKNAAREFEELDMLSSAEDEEDEVNDEAGRRPAPAKPKGRRVSAWQRQHNTDGTTDELPDELPDDWKDSQASKRRRREARQPTSKMLKPATDSPQPARGKTAGKSLPGLRPSGAAAVINQSSDESDENEVEEQLLSEAKQHAARSRADIASREEEDEEEDGVKGVAMAGTSRGSVLANGKLGGKKIKIVSAKEKQKSIDSEIPMTSFSAINRPKPIASSTIQISSDSEDSSDGDGIIPARARV